MLLAPRVRECHVYCELVPFDAPWEDVQKLNPRGFILSGGPASVYDEGAPLAPTYVFDSGLPVLGICYRMNLIALPRRARPGTPPTPPVGNDPGVIGLQFHPEVVHTPQGQALIENFVLRVCGCTGDWTAGNFIAASIPPVRRPVGDGR